MGKLKILFKELKIYRKSPEIKFFFLVFGFFFFLFFLNFFFLPKFLKLVTLVLFLGILIFSLIKSLELAKKNQEIKIQSQKLELIIENFDAGIIIYDQNFRVINFNKEAEKIFNLKAQEIIGQYLNPDQGKNPYFRRLIQVIFPSLAPIVNLLSEPDHWPQIVDITLEEPEQHLRTFLSRIVDSQGNLIGFLKIIRDRTREKFILKSKSEFISIAAHQLRTPLTAISWAFETLMNNFEKKENLEIIKSGYQSTQQALKTINDLLEISKIEEGKFGYNFEETEINDFVQKIIDYFEPIAQQKKINLIFQPLPQKTTVKIDLQKLGIALGNLIDNAIRYNLPNGKVEVKIEKLSNQPFIQIQIKDTGLGIPQEEKEKIFTKFFRGSNILSVEPNGSGLGLYITKNIIHQHGGKIYFESIQDRGTTFYFTLPLDFSLIPAKEIPHEDF